LNTRKYGKKSIDKGVRNLRLVKVKIHGFKSFPDRTEFDFDKDIIALVGPNGCGKSNVVDAIYWIFQHTGLKSLRANEKQDLIFKGNNYRNRSGFAEVELIFKKNNHELSDEDFISVKKRVYQSGEVQYFLNNNQVKYKEYENFFYENHITSPEYSIIAQGKVEKIISSKPEEKREIIEEAAGIKKYKKDRKDAIDRLNRTKEDYEIIGIETTLPFCKYVMRHDAFISGNFDTHFVNNHFAPEKLETTLDDDVLELAAIAGALFVEKDKNSIKKTYTAIEPNVWRNNRS